MKKLLILPFLASVAMAKPAWKPLFNGTSFAPDWEVIGDTRGLWSVKDSAIVGASTSGSNYTMVFTKKDNFDQFTVKYSYRLKAGCSGFFFRAKKTDKTELVEGVQIEAKYDNRLSKLGSLYSWPANKWVAETVPPFDDVAARPVSQYQDVILTVKSPFVYVNINGFQAIGATGASANGAVARWNYTDARYYCTAPGKFGLQIHGGQQTMDVAFKNIAILEGCNDPASPNYDGAFLPGMPEQAAYYQDNGTCTSSKVNSDGELRNYFGFVDMREGGAGLEVTYPNPHSLDIINLHGKTVFSGASPSAKNYQFTKKIEAGVYLAKVQTKSGSISRKIIIP